MNLIMIPKAADRRVAVPRPRRPALPGTAPLYALNFGLALPVWWRLRIASARNRRSWRGRVRATVRSRANGRARSNGRTCSKCVRMLPNPSELRQPNRDCGHKLSKMRSNASKPIEAPSAKYRLWPEMNASKCFTAEKAGKCSSDRCENYA